VRKSGLEAVSDTESMLTCPFAVCLYVWHKREQRSGENRVGDDDRQSRAFIFSEWKSGCMMGDDGSGNGGSWSRRRRG